MPNPDFNTQVAQGYSKKGGNAYVVRKGGGKSEDGPAKKDTVKGWPNPQPEWKSSFNRGAKVPVIKTRVVSHGID